MEIFSLILKSFGVLTVFYAVYKLILQKNTLFTAHRYFLLAGLLVAMVIPFVTFTKTVMVTLPSQPIENTPYNSFLDSPIATPQIALANPEIDWWALLLVIYSVGAVCMLIKVFVQIFTLYKLINSGTRVHTSSYTYIEISNEIPPFSFFSYIVYNPSAHTLEDLKMILAHERVHARELHSIDILTTQILLVFHWFNPLIWFYKQSLEQNLEYIADQKAVQQITNNLKNYQRALVKVSSPSYKLALTNQFYQSFIKKRIVMLNTPKSHKRNLWKLGIVVPLLALFMYSFNVEEITEYVEEDYAYAKNRSVTQLIDRKIIEPKNEEIVSSNTQAEEPNNLEVLKGATRSTSTNQVSNTNREGSDTVQSSPSERSYKTIGQTQKSLELQETYRFKITKNTTIEELVALKKMLKAKHNATLKYGSIDYNEAGEMTSIRLSFKDANGNSKNYTIQSKAPIADIYIYRDANGTTGMGNVASREEAADRFDELREQMEKRRNMMLEDRDSMRVQMETRRKEMRTIMEERREKMNLSGKVLRKNSDSLRKNMMMRRDSIRMIRFSQKDSIKEGRKTYKDSLRMITGKSVSNIQKSGYLQLDNETYYYARKNDGTIGYYNKWGTEIQKGDPLYNKLKNVSPYSINYKGEQDVRQSAINLLRSQSDINKDPLVLINGIVTTKERMNQLDPNIIELISILKDEKATSAYGERGKNGVIVIETKD